MKTPSEFYIAFVNDTEGPISYIRTGQENREVSRLLRSDGFGWLSQVLCPSHETQPKIVRIPRDHIEHLKYTLAYEGIPVVEVPVTFLELDRQTPDALWEIVEMRARQINDLPESAYRDAAKMVDEGGPDSPDTSDDPPSDPRPVVRSFTELRDTGLMALINAQVFHPRGFALTFHYNDPGVLIGWSLQGDGSEPWGYHNWQEQFERAKEFIAGNPRYYQGNE